jgi:hypothetical protein
MRCDPRPDPASGRSRLAAIVVAVLLLAGAGRASAELGGDAGSVEADRAHMNAEARVERGQKYAVHELTVPGGTTVRQYVSPSGRVFAVTWSGPQMPDLKQLLGSYFETFRKAPAVKSGERGPLRVEDPALVVYSGGHMRAYQGRAYDPRLVPVDVPADELK